MQDRHPPLLNPKLNAWKSKGSYFSYKGLELFYIREGSGPVLLLCHGYPYNSYDFEPLWSSLTSRYTVIAADMPGMGFSDKPGTYNYCFAGMSGMYKALLLHCQVVSAHILSHDLGNSVVQELLSEFEEGRLSFTIQTIAFLNGGLFSSVYRPRLIQVLLSKTPAPVGQFLSRLLTKKLVMKATAEVFGKHTKPSPELEDIFWEILNYKNGRSVSHLLGRLVFEKDRYQARWITAMQQTRVPMCFINGPADPNSGIHMAEKYRQLIPQPVLFILNEQIGHWPQIEAPEEVLKAYHSFITNADMAR